jgi:hypothetical protein
MFLYETRMQEEEELTLRCIQNHGNTMPMSFINSKFGKCLSNSLINMFIISKQIDLSLA